MAHILLVADDESVTAALERRLIATGHDVAVCTAAAAQNLLGQPYDLVIACGVHTTQQPGAGSVNSGASLTYIGDSARRVLARTDGRKNDSELFALFAQLDRLRRSRLDAYEAKEGDPLFGDPLWLEDAIDEIYDRLYLFKPATIAGAIALLESIGTHVPPEVRDTVVAGLREVAART